MKITFLGASHTVTGSCYLVETNSARFLVDCGMFQGQDVEHLNQKDFSFDAKNIDFVLLTHAHIDHSGLLPKLAKYGFRGRVYMTSPTAKLAELLLMDSAKIQDNNLLRGLTKKSLYSTQDSQQIISQFISVRFEEQIELQSLQIQFIRVGHILGAASIVIKAEGKTIIFSGDIGRVNQSIIKSANYSKLPSKIDAIVTESLYGGVTHPQKALSIGSFLEEINYRMTRNGNVIIPAFALHRSQEILEILHLAYKNNIISNNVQLFIDSPLAEKITRIYTEEISEQNTSISFNGKDYEYSGFNTESLVKDLSRNELSYNNRFYFDNARFVNRHKQSLKISNKKNSIIIAGSGMADGGRVVHHIIRNISNPNSTILFVGFQAIGTLGRELVDGNKSVQIEDKFYPVKAKIINIQGFSAHADQDDLFKWISSMSGYKSAKIFLVHAELERSEQYKIFLEKNGAHNVLIPDISEQFTL